MPDKDADLIEFVRGNREPFAIDEASSELAFLGRSGTGWPQATTEHWKRELQRLVNEGKLTECDGMLTVARVESLKQGSLFD